MRNIGPELAGHVIRTYIKGMIHSDEAPDFTSLELELIQKLSLYTQRDLPSYLARHVPFAFAGDPFQTLNPTGFKMAPSSFDLRP